MDTPIKNTAQQTGLLLSVTVKLDFPIKFDGVQRDRLTLRRPKVRDMRAAAKLAPNDEEAREIALFAMLAEVAPSDLEDMDLADYNRLQDEYFRFRSTVKRAAGDAQEVTAAAADGTADVAG